MNEWREVRLEDIGEIITGKTPSTKEINNFGNDYLFLTPKDMDDKKNKYTTERNLSIIGIKKLNKQIIKPNSICVSCIGSDMGKVCILKKVGLTNQQINSITNIKKDFNYEFIYYKLSLMKKFFQIIASGTTIPILNKNDFSKIEIKVPKITIQEKIIKILSGIDEKIELNNKINDNLEKQLQLLYKNWFIDLKPFNGITNWKHGKLKDILNLEKRIFKKESKIEFPYLPLDMIPMHSFAIKQVKPFSEAQSSLIKFLKDDILIGAMRVYFHRVTIAPFDGITRNTCFTLSVKEKEYLAFSLIYCNLKETIKFAEKTSKGTTMPYAVWENGLSEIDLLIPPKEIAEKFNTFALPLIRKIQNSYFDNKNLSNLKNYLLPKLMNGEIDVENIEL